MFISAKSRSNRHVEKPTLLPPKLTELGHRPFTSHERESLAHWLQDGAWPRDTLNIYSLEGYLTALLVWPVALQPGAWLPPIWNETGWRVRPPIDTSDRYAEFLEFILGFVRTIDHGLLQSPPVFESSLGLKFDRSLPDAQVRAQHWALGFGRGLEQGVQMRVAPTEGAREAVQAIAAYAADQPPFSKGGLQHAESVLTKAVLSLASTRTSRGPLGTLPKRAASAQPADAPTQPPEDPMVENE
jgi:yecA family protein